MQSGVVLLEALIAILLFSMGVLAIVGLQATMVKNVADSKYRAEAGYLAQQKIGEMWADVDGKYVPAPSPSQKGHEFAGYADLYHNTDISSSLPGGLLTVTHPSAYQYMVVVGWTAPGEDPADDDTTPPCYMAVAHCVTTVASIVWE